MSNAIQSFGKGALRVAKNYTKGYSETQVRLHPHLWTTARPRHDDGQRRGRVTDPRQLGTMELRVEWAAMYLMACLSSRMDEG